MDKRHKLISARAAVARFAKIYLVILTIFLFPHIFSNHILKISP